MAILDNEFQLSIHAEGLDHAEGIAWGLDGYVYAGGEAGQIYRIDLDGNSLTEIANTGGFVLGLALDASSNIYACDIYNKCVQKITPDGTISVYSYGAEDEPFTAPNYPAFDSNGNLFVCDSGEWKADNGKIYKISPGGKCEVWDRRLKEFPNGICLGPSGKFLVVVVSLNPPRVAKIFLKSDGNAGETEIIAKLPGTVPDGVAFDSSGTLYVACYRPDRIYRILPTGDTQILADDYEGTFMASPTNIAFCGDNLETMLAPNLGRWHITRYDADVTGLPLHYPDLD